MLHEWNFLFLIGAVLALIAIQFLPRVRESGEVHKSVVKRIMRTSLRSNLRDYFVIDVLINWHSTLNNMLKSNRVSSEAAEQDNTAG